MICSKCNINQDISNFSSRNTEKYRKAKYRTVCKDCCRTQSNLSYHKYKKQSPFKCRCTKLKATAKTKNIPFSLTPLYLEQIWTGVCPISKIQLDWHATKGDEHAPELDRLIPSKGYIVGNVTWISRKMNRLKNNASKDDLELLLNWLKEQDVN